MNRRKQTPIRFLALVMAIATITSFSLFATAQGVIIDNTYEQLMLQQEDAVAANELLNEAFGHDAVGNITFPNDFAGARIEENKLVLSLTNTGIDNTTKYLNWVGDYADCLAFEKVDYSYLTMLLGSFQLRCQYDIPPCTCSSGIGAATILSPSRRNISGCRNCSANRSASSCGRSVKSDSPSPTIKKFPATMS